MDRLSELVKFFILGGFSFTLQTSDLIDGVEVPLGKGSFRFETLGPVDNGFFLGFLFLRWHYD